MIAFRLPGGDPAKAIQMVGPVIMNLTVHPAGSWIVWTIDRRWVVSEQRMAQLAPYSSRLDPARRPLEATA